MKMELLQTLRKIRACEGDAAAQLLLEAYVGQEVAYEREQWEYCAKMLLQSQLGGATFSTAVRGLTELIERA
jgi:hypothetical protein